MAVGWSYEKRAAIGSNEVPLVIGCGAIGLSVVAALRRRGIGPIVAVDFNESRRAVARTLGADVLIDPAATSPYAAWREVAHGGDPSAVRGIFDSVNLASCVAFECVGVSGVLDDIVMNCERSTRILSAGGCPEGDHIHSAAAHRKGLNIQFGGGPSVPDWNEALKEVCSGNIDVRPIVGETIGLDAVPDALRRSKQREAPPRIVITP
jgi:threonine dehydrogenase-like Zn-dependent dehydrogenase